jgi:hypothetical protein
MSSSLRVGTACLAIVHEPIETRNWKKIDELGIPSPLFKHGKQALIPDSHS